MKAMLTINMPKDCIQCPCCDWIHVIRSDPNEDNYVTCKVMWKSIKVEYDKEDNKLFFVRIPEWCPLEYSEC